MRKVTLTEQRTNMTPDRKKRETEYKHRGDFRKRPKISGLKLGEKPSGVGES